MDESIDENQSKTTLIAAHTRSTKTGRQPLPDSLPRVDVVHELRDVDGNP